MDESQSFRFPEPVDPSLAVFLYVHASVASVIFFPALIMLVIRRHHRAIAYRQFSTLVMFLMFSFGFGLVQTASMLTSKPGFCETINVMYALWPVITLHFILLIPTIVLQTDLCELRVSRCVRSEASKKFWLAHMFFQTKVRVAMFLVIGILHAAFYLCLRYLTSFPGDCNRTAIMAYSISLMVFIVALSYFNFKMLKAKDPFFIRDEVMIGNLVHGPVILIMFIYPFAPMVFPPWFDIRWTSVATMFPITFFNLIFPLLLTNEKFLKKIECLRANLISEEDQKEIDTKGTIFAFSKGISIFQAVLSNNILLDEFMQFTIAEWSVENVLFYRAVEEFKTLFQENKSEAKEKARFICSEFVVPGAPIEVNLDHVTRNRLLQEVESELNETTFNHAQRSIYELMEKDSFPKWQKTSSFKKALEKVVDGRSSTNSGSLGGSRPLSMEISMS